MLLINVNSGKRVRIKAVDAGRRLQAHLASMGLVPGAELEVIDGRTQGPFVVSIGGQRLVLGNGMVQKIVVS